MCGDRAPYTSVAKASGAARSLRRGSLAVFPQVGHFPMLEAAEQVTSVLREFVATCAGPRAHHAPGAWDFHIDCVWSGLEPVGVEGAAVKDAPDADEISRAYVRGVL